MSLINDRCLELQKNKTGKCDMAVSRKKMYVYIKLNLLNRARSELSKISNFISVIMIISQFIFPIKDKLCM